MTLLLVFAVMLVSFGTIAWPFFERRRRPDDTPRTRKPWDDLVSRRNAAYQALKELEFEYNLGNLSDEDYTDLRERYRSQAAGILQRLDTEMNQTEPDAPPAATSPQTPETACAFCGEDIEPGDAFCWRCGGRLDRRCADCGEVLLEDDMFCGCCGRSLEAAV
jgi:hypothetical protein